MNAHTRELLPLLAVENMEVLQALDRHDVAFASISDFARSLGKDPSNVNKTLKKLCDAGLCIWPADGVLPFKDGPGQAAVEAWARAHGGGAGPDLVVEITLDRIDPWDGNPRTWFDPDSVQDMAQSIADKGVQEPITVRRKGAPGNERFEVIKGERRRRGARLAQSLGTLPADFAMPCQVSDADDEEALELAGIENIQREDMHWFDLARYFARLMQKKSGPELERLFGRKFSARKIQDYAKIARELGAELAARCYLPDGDKAQITYVIARELVGEKREKPALDLTGKLACCLAELVNAAHPGFPFPTTGTLRAPLYAAPVGGPIGTLAERKLVKPAFEDGDMVVQIPLTEELLKWLGQLDFINNRSGALFKVRSLALGGDLAASTHPALLNLTRELNPPAARDPDPRSFTDQLLAAGGAAPVPPPSGEGDREAVEGVPPDAPTFREAVHAALLQTYGVPAPDGLDRMIDEALASGHTAEECVAAVGARFDLEVLPSRVGDARTDAEEPLTLADRRLLGIGDKPPAPPAPNAEDLTLPPMLAIVLVEAAHKLALEGIERGPGTWAAPILAEAHKDTRLQTLIQGHRLIALLPMGERWMICLTTRGLDYLARTELIGSDNGRPQGVSLGDLMDAQKEFVGAVPEGRLYSTPWLNKPPAEARAPEPDHIAEAAAPNLPHGGEQADREAASAAPATPTLVVTAATVEALGQVLRQVDRLLARIHNGSKPGPTEIPDTRKWIARVMTATGLEAPPEMM